MLSFRLKIKEDTVSADRKEQIVFDPDAWSKKDKSGRKISNITSRQNFDNEKFTRRKNKGEIEEEIQTSGSSGYDTGTTPASNTVQPADPIKKKKSNNPQIEFVTGTAQPNGSSSTAIGNQPMTGRKLAEALIKKAMKKTKTTCSEEAEQIDEAGYGRNRGYSHGFASPHAPSLGRREREDDEYHVPDPVSSSRSDVPHAVHINGKKWKSFGSQSHATNVAKKIKGATVHKEEAEHSLSEAQYAGLEKEDKPGKVKTAAESPHPNGVNIDTVEGFKDEQKPTAPKQKKQKLGEGMKTYSQFIDQLLEYTPGPDGRTIVKGRSYGAQYHDPEGDDEAWEKEGTVKMKPATQEKRGRGRPSGSYGTYKARSADTKAAAAAKSAASKAANKAK